MHWVVQVIHNMNFPYKDDGLWKPERTSFYPAYSYSILMFKVFRSSHMLLVCFVDFSGRDALYPQLRRRPQMCWIITPVLEVEDT